MDIIHGALLQEEIIETLSHYYDIGNNSLEVYLGGQRLIKDIHYEEITDMSIGSDGNPVVSKISNKVRFLHDGVWILTEDVTVTFVIRRSSTARNDRNSRKRGK